jgi:hypothetical protein
MDFDDMPDSYFAFLSNQRKLVEPDKINGAMRDLGRGSEPEARLRSRVSQPNLSAGSKPSVPSLPSIPRTVTGPAPAPVAMQPASGRFGVPASRPPPGSRPPTPYAPAPPAPMNQAGPMNHQGQVHPMGPMGRAGHANPMGPVAVPTVAPSNGHGYHGQPMGARVAAPRRSNALVFALIAVLIAAIGVLAYLVLTK